MSENLNYPHVNERLVIVACQSHSLLSDYWNSGSWAKAMSESDSVHKTVVGWKVFNFRSDLKKCTKRGLPKGLAERVEEFDENFKLMFHLRRSDLEDWISKTSSTEMFVCEVESART